MGLHNFLVDEAYAHIMPDGGTFIELIYPVDKIPFECRLPINAKFGINMWNDLFEYKYARIASDEAKLKPPSAGGVIFLDDGKSIVTSLRNDRPRTHSVYWNWYGGFPEPEEGVHTERALMCTAVRERSEGILVTKDNPPWLIVPKDAIAETLIAASHIGLEFGSRLKGVDVEYLPSRDRLEIWEDKKLVYSTKGLFHFEFFHEQTSSINGLLATVYKGVSSDEVLPIDTEGEDAISPIAYKWFNLRASIWPLGLVNGLEFGAPLPSGIKVYQTRVEKGVPFVEEAPVSPPFLGPDNVPVNVPYLFTPEDGLTRILSRAGVRIRLFKDYSSCDWHRIEQWKTQQVYRNRPVLSELITDKVIDSSRMKDWVPRWIEPGRDEKKK